MALPLFVDPRLRVAPSLIHGRGVFARVDIPEGTLLDEGLGDDYPATLDQLHRRDVIYVAGQLVGFTGHTWSDYLNHGTPAVSYQLRNGEAVAVATRDIEAGEELLLDYRTALHPDDPVLAEVLGAPR